MTGKRPGKGNTPMMKKKITESLLIIAYAFLLCLCAALLCSNASAENAVDLANTPNQDGWLDVCTLPDGGLVFAGYTEMQTEDGPDKGRLLCLNPDRTVRWTYTDPDAFSYGTVKLLKDGTIAVFSYNGVKFFTPDGQPAGKDISLPYTNGDIYDITSLGILHAQRQADEAQAESLVLTGWDGSTLFRISEPESMWAGSAPIEEEDGLVLFGQESGDPAQAAAKMMKVDLEGNSVWQSVMPFLSEKRLSTSVNACCKTSDGGYLAVLWDLITDPDSGTENSNHVLVKFDSAGKLLWMLPTRFAFWQTAEYDGKYVGYTHAFDWETNRPFMRYLWVDADGNELGTTELHFSEEDLPRYTGPADMSLSVEKMIPMSDGLWQVLCFWKTDEPKEDDPAWSRQDNLLLRVPEL